MKLTVFWLSYLWFPFALACLLLWLRTHDRSIRWLIAGAFVLSLPLAWARFVEPRLLLVKETTVVLAGYEDADEPVRIALFADMHLGLFPNAHSMQHLVDKIETLNVDAVFLAGDLLYDIPLADIHQAVAPLSDLTAPTFVVRGNHDIGAPGPDYGLVLWDALQDTGVTLVENRSFDVELGGQPFLIAGTSDLWQRNNSPRVRFETPEDVPVLLLTHNPDTALSVPEEVRYDLMLAGHTHGGQIRLPFLTRAVILTEYPFDTGMHTLPDGRRVFVTPGTGMVGLPMRFLRPPRIDVLNLEFTTGE